MELYRKKFPKPRGNSGLIIDEIKAFNGLKYSQIDFA